MSVENFNGIGFSRATGTVFIDIASQRPSAAAAPPAETTQPDQTKPAEDAISPAGFARWGDDNLLPLQMVEDIEKCGVLQSTIHDVASFAIGKGPKAYELVASLPDGTEKLNEIVDNEISDWMEENDFYNTAFATTKDVTGMGNYLARFKFTKDGSKIGLCWRHDVSEMRLEIKDSTGRIRNVFLSAQWDRISTYDKSDNRILTIPALPAMNPGNFLTDIDASKRKNKEFALHGRRPGWNRHYYSLAGWQSVKDWVDISKAVPGMKAAMYENNIRIKYIVVIHERYWEKQYKDWNTYGPVEKQRLIEALWDKIDQYLAGSKNAGKSIFVTGWVDQVTQKAVQDIEIKPIDDTTKQGEYLPDSAAADKQIMFSLGFNPAINGANLLSDGAKGGAGSGSDIREAILGMINKTEFERQQIARILNVVRKVNNWQPGKRLVWRFPGLILTTLDKGKSTEPVNN